MDLVLARTIISYTVRPDKLVTAKGVALASAVTPRPEATQRSCLVISRRKAFGVSTSSEGGTRSRNASDGLGVVVRDGPNTLSLDVTDGGPTKAVGIVSGSVGTTGAVLPVKAVKRAFVVVALARTATYA